MIVSIITPVFNQGEFIKDCMRSVKAQSYPDIEHIIVDNCSTDDTADVVKTESIGYTVKYIREPDNGQANAVNKGAAYSSGEICFWLNADDYLSSNDVVFTVVNAFLRSKNCDAVYGGVTFFDENSNWMKYVPPFKMNKKMFLHVAFIGNSNIFLRREVFIKNKVDENLHFVIDHEWLLRIFNKDLSYKRINMSICHFRRHPLSKTSLISEDNKNIERSERDYSFSNKGMFFLFSRIFYKILFKIKLFLK